MNLFHSARLKITFFYFVILLLFCLILTIGIRSFANYEFNRSNDAQRRSVHNLVVRLYEPGLKPPPTDRVFANAQDHQSALTDANLTRDVLLVDVVALVLGAWLSYWYAGYTLKPIEEAHEEQKRFTSDASHELRTPLASMQLENEVFLRQKHFSEGEARDQLVSNLEEVARLERLATNLLALNHYESTRLDRKPVDVVAAANSAIDRSKHTAAAKHVRLDNTLPPGTVMADPESVTELIAILLDNAIKYGPKNDTVSLEGDISNEGYILRVRDHGKGIADEDLPHIFERLYRGDKARSSKISGHGIGLSLAQQIAQANDVRLEVANHAEGGAVFSIVLPLK